MATNMNLTVNYQTQRNGPWFPIVVIINLDKFIEAKSPDLYVKGLVEMSTIGEEIISVSYSFSKADARELIHKSGRV